LWFHSSIPTPFHFVPFHFVPFHFIPSHPIHSSLSIHPIPPHPFIPFHSSHPIPSIHPFPFIPSHPFRVQNADKPDRRTQRRPAQPRATKTRQDRHTAPKETSFTPHITFPAWRN
jgi:hypothetical protein